ncbi:hypothetical protein [uncultured Desulfobacter sp.]|uniref:hypothetical protein n=1 Tax=uncultured Desulfobacter sp. TaxID=240139 RepID=UPI002AAB2800|nr:hypothetical protein [uncultured Desulfobacter sp.]
MNATAGLLVLLSSQFRTEDFSPTESALSIGSNGYYTGQSAIGGFFQIEFPDDWSEDEKYDFNWSELKKQSDRFEKINYDDL